MFLRLAVFLPGILLVILAAARPWLESTMARHMTVEFPLLIAIGCLAAHLAGTQLTRSMQSWNANGVPAILSGFLIVMFWMLPVAVDLAVLNSFVATMKILSLVAAGLLVGASWRMAGMVVQAFFLLNTVWMTATVGLLYQEAPQQLCSVYLNDEQNAAGTGMVLLAVAILVFWLWRVLYQLMAIDQLPPDLGVH